ncbi:MAG: discoidin domain-containing protein, partial [Trebonia sp.]
MAVAALVVTALVSGVGAAVPKASAATCGTTNLALNQPATASSYENQTAYPASAAVDGNTGTRWSSAFSDPQWLEVDLGSSQSICQVGLDWEAAYATAFQIQVSTDNTNWTTIYSTTTGTGGDQTLSVSGTGRYIRMYGTARATQYGYSLWEFQVYGGSGGGTGTGGVDISAGGPAAAPFVADEDYTGGATAATTNAITTTGVTNPA